MKNRLAIKYHIENDTLPAHLLGKKNRFRDFIFIILYLFHIYLVSINISIYLIKCLIKSNECSFKPSEYSFESAREVNYSSGRKDDFDLNFRRFSARLRLDEPGDGCRTVQRHNIQHAEKYVGEGSYFEAYLWHYVELFYPLTEWVIDIQEIVGETLYKEASRLGSAMIKHVPQADFWNESDFRGQCPSHLVNLCQEGKMRFVPPITDEKIKKESTNSLHMIKLSSIF